MPGVVDRASQLSASPQGSSGPLISPANFESVDFIYNEPDLLRPAPVLDGFPAAYYFGGHYGNTVGMTHDIGGTELTNPYTLDDPNVHAEEFQAQHAFHPTSFNRTVPDLSVTHAPYAVRYPSSYQEECEPSMPDHFATPDFRPMTRQTLYTQRTPEWTSMAASTPLSLHDRTRFSLPRGLRQDSGAPAPVDFRPQDSRVPMTTLCASRSNTVTTTNPSDLESEESGNEASTPENSPFEKVNPDSSTTTPDTDNSGRTGSRRRSLRSSRARQCKQKRHRRRPSPGSDPINMEIMRRRCEGKQAWETIAEHLNSCPDFCRPSKPHTVASVYGRFKRNGPRIAAKSGDMNFDPAEWMHIYHAKDRRRVVECHNVPRRTHPPATTLGHQFITSSRRGLSSEDSSPGTAAQDEISYAIRNLAYRRGIDTGLWQAVADQVSNELGAVYTSEEIANIVVKSAAP